MEADYFKHFLHSNSLIAFGIMLLTGLIGGQLAHMARFIPRIMGYILIGFILGPHVVGIISQSLIDQTHIFEELAIGLILFELGLQLDLKTLSAQPALFWTALLQSALVFIIVFIGLSLFKVNLISAAVAAAIGVSISPAITLLIAKEYGAQGEVINCSLTLTALNNIFAFFYYAFTVALAQLNSFQNEHFHSLVIELLYPGYHMVGSIFLAALLAKLIIMLGKFIGKKENLQFILLVGMLILTLGISKLLYVSPYLTMLIFGILTVNLDRKQDLMEVELGYMGEIFIVILFVSVGASLKLDYFLNAGWLALAFIGLRLLGNIAAIFLMRNKIALNIRQSLSLGITLVPMAGIAIALLATTEKLASNIHSSIYTIVLPAIALLETIGPLTTILSLKWIGELDSDSKQQLDH